MRFYLAIVLAATYNHLFASPVSWPSASSRIGQDIYKACDSDLYIAEFLHPEHAYNCISTSVRMYSSVPVNPGNPSSGIEDVSMCSDQALIICLCGQGLGHCPSDYRVARYYVCSNPFEFPDSEPVAEAYDGPYARFISSVGAYDCTKPTEETKTDPNKGDSYGDSNVGDNSTGGETGNGGSSGGSGGSGSGDTGSDGSGSGDGSSGDSGDGSVDPSDYNCAQIGSENVDFYTAYDNCVASLSGVYESDGDSAGSYNWCGTGNTSYDGSGSDLSCDYTQYDGEPGCCGTSPWSDCRCSWSDATSAYWSNCSSYSGCSVGAPSHERVPCYKVFDSFPSGSILKCQLTISKPGGGNWTREWSVPATSSCEASCQQYRDEYSSEFPPSGGDSGPEDPEDYEDCEATDGCNWVGAPMGYGVCHCDDTDSGSGSDDKGTGPTSRDGRSNGQNGTGTECGKGANGTNCEDTQKKVLNTVSELNESVEDFSGWLKKKPTLNNGANEEKLKSLDSRFQSDINSDSFSDLIFQDSNFQVWKQKLLDQIQQIKTESVSLTDSIIPVPPSSSGNYGCLEFSFFSSHFGPSCLSTYLEPVIPQINSFLQFFKYFVGFLILFRK